MLPEMYQGLGMFNLSLDCLAARINYLRRHWGLSTAVGSMLKQGYEVFQMDLGLQGNIFCRDYDALGSLAADSWMKTTWQLCHRFQVQLLVDKKT